MDITPKAARAVGDPTDLLLSRLDGVRRSGKGWTARCPAHADRSPSLSIGHGRDGRVLLHCFSGCDVAAVLAAIGLDLSDLFAERLGDRSPLGRHERREATQRADWRAALSVLSHEATIVAIVANAVCDWLLDDEDRARLALAIKRIESARSVLS